MIAQMKGKYPIKRVCEALECPRSTAYYAPTKRDDPKLVEAVEQFGKLLRLAQVSLHHLTPVLEQHAHARVLEDGVSERVAALDFLADFRNQVVGRIFGLPIAVRQSVLVAQHAVVAHAPLADTLAGSATSVQFLTLAVSPRSA